MSGTKENIAHDGLQLFNEIIATSRPVAGSKQVDIDSPFSRTVRRRARYRLRKSKSDGCDLLALHTKNDTAAPKAPRGLKHHHSQPPPSYQQPSWTNYKVRATSPVMDSKHKKRLRDKPSRRHSAFAAKRVLERKLLRASPSSTLKSLGKRVLAGIRLRPKRARTPMK